MKSIVNVLVLKVYRLGVPAGRILTALTKTWIISVVHLEALVWLSVLGLFSGLSLVCDCRLFA